MLREIRKHDPTRTETRTAARAEALRAAEQGPVSETALDESEPSPPLRRHFVTPNVAQVPMTLGEAAAAHVRFIIWCLPFEEPHGFAGCHHQVEPVTVLLRAAEGDGTKCRAAEMGSPAKIDYRKNFFGLDPQLSRLPAPFGHDPTNLANAFTRSGLVKHFWNLPGSEQQPHGPAPPGAETELMASSTSEPGMASWEAEPVEIEPRGGSASVGSVSVTPGDARRLTSPI
jgi:hypothetical protein